MDEKTYFKGVTEISLDDWNYTYMGAYDDGIIQDHSNLLPEHAQFSGDIFETIIEDTDGSLYHIVAKIPEDREVVVFVKPFKEKTI